MAGCSLVLLMSLAGSAIATDSGVQRGAAAAPAATHRPATGVFSASGETTLRSCDGSIFAWPRHATNQRTITFADSRTVMLAWDEPGRGAAGRPLSRFAISRDGQQIDQVMTTGNMVRLRYQSFDPLEMLPRVPDVLAAREGNELFLVQFVGTPLEEMRHEIEQLGGSVQRFLTDNTHIVQMAAATHARVQELPYVRWVGPYHPAYRLDEEILAAVAFGDDGAARRYGIELMTRGLGAQQEVADEVLRAWGRRGAVVDRTASMTHRMEATLTLQQMIELAHRNDVSFIDPWQAPGSHINIARQMSGATPTLANAGFLGQGVRGEVIDSAIQMNHPEWATKPPILHRPITGAGAVHGTNVYGILFSSGIDPQAQGFLPQHEAGIFGHFMEIINNPASRIGWFMESVDPAGPYRVVFQNNSWGQGQSLNYTTISREVDDAVFQSGLLVAQSQANNNTQLSAVEAWSKNVVSIGGIRHNNVLDPLTHTRSGASIGFAADGRIKPDLAHFFESIYTTTPTSGYTPSFGGTSAASPITAGAFGLIMQMWHEGIFAGFGGASTVFDSRPHYATVKALAIASAYRYNWTSGTPANASLTREIQGWGVADVAQLHSMRDSMFIVNGTDLLHNAESILYSVAVEPGEPQLLITVAFSDPPGNPAAAQARINDLDLKVTSPGGIIYWGNHGLRQGNWSLAGGSPSSLDQVENVFIQDPEPGTWMIEIIGTQIVEDAVPTAPGVQANFGLAVLGAVGGEAPPLLMSFPAGLPASVAPGTPVEVIISITENTQTIQPGTVKAHVRTSAAGSFSEFALSPIGPNQYRAVLPGFVCSDEPEIYFSAQGHLGDIVSLPRLAPVNTFTTEVGAPQETTLLAVDFGSELPAGWSATGLWHMSTSRCIPGGQCASLPSPPPPTDWWAYYGRLFACNYHTGGRTTGRLTAPDITLPSPPPGGRIVLTFCSALETENAPNVDKAEVFINQDMVLRVPDSSSWMVREIDLTSYAGQTVSIAWSFDSIDGSNNSFRGWQINAVRLTADLLACETPCYANCDSSTAEPILNVDDFTCFINSFAAAQALPPEQQIAHYANCDHSTAAPILNVDDFTCFINSFAAGCP